MSYWSSWSHGSKCELCVWGFCCEGGPSLRTASLVTSSVLKVFCGTFSSSTSGSCLRPQCWNLSLSFDLHLWVVDYFLYYYFFFSKNIYCQVSGQGTLDRWPFALTFFNDQVTGFNTTQMAPPKFLHQDFLLLIPVNYRDCAPVREPRTTPRRCHGNRHVLLTVLWLPRLH